MVVCSASRVQPSWVKVPREAAIAEPEMSRSAVFESPSNSQSQPPWVCVHGTVSVYPPLPSPRYLPSLLIDLPSLSPPLTRPLYLAPLPSTVHPSPPPCTHTVHLLPLHLLSVPHLSSPPLNPPLRPSTLLSVPTPPSTSPLY